MKRFWDMRFYFYDVRKHIVAQLAGELGVNVLQTDTDAAWFANPSRPPEDGRGARGNLVVQWDAPFVNAGVFYAQNVTRGDATHWVLAELHRRIALFMYRPEAAEGRSRSAAAVLCQLGRADADERRAHLVDDEPYVLHLVDGL